MIGLISDTHDHLEHLEKAIALFAQKKVTAVVHAGDVCSPFVWPLFSDLNVPIYCVLGNNVGDVLRQQAQIKKFNMDVVLDPFFLSVVHAGKRIGVYHGDPYAVVDALARSQDYDLIVYGHNHIAKIHSVGKTLLVNPGSLVTKTSHPKSVLKGPNNPGPSAALYDPKKQSATLVFL